MLLKTSLAHLLTAFSIAQAYAIPIQPFRAHSPSHQVAHRASTIHERHSRPLKRQYLERRGGIIPSLWDGIIRLGGSPEHVITLVPAPVHTSPSQRAPTSFTVIETSQVTSTVSSSRAVTVSTSPTPTIMSQVVQNVASSTASNLNSAENAPPTISVAPSVIKPSAAAYTTKTAPGIPTTIPVAIPLNNGGSRKYVVAHHMIGNTFPYTIQDWEEDISMAHAAGIDGFALNCGIDEWEPARVADAYEAAKRSGLDFKMFISLDMSSFPCGSPGDAHRLRELIQPYLDHPSQLQYDSRAFVSTFAGETCTFGQANVLEGWKTQFVEHPNLQGKIYFVPAFFIDPAKFGEFSDIMNGDFNWNSGWPTKITTSFAKELVASLPVAAMNNPIQNTNIRIANAAVDPSFDPLTLGLSTIESTLDRFIGSTESDGEHLKGLEAISGAIQARDGSKQKPVYMGAVSPWFFTHYGQDSYNKNWIFLADQHLYAKRWESIISNRDQFDVIQVLTWNDYGESHYIGPIKGAQPDSEAWVNGFNHTAWLGLTQYYATAYKTGAFPPIDQDKIFMWSRPHPCRAKADDPIGRPDNFELSQDMVWAVVMTTAPSTVTLSTSADNLKQFKVPPGVSKLSIPITAGGTMKGVIQRDGETVVELAPSEFTFQENPTVYNFNAFVASAAAK